MDEKRSRRGQKGVFPKAVGTEKQCTARTRSGDRCRAYAVEGFTVCRMHGAGTRKHPGGAGNAEKPGGRPVTTGEHSERLRNSEDIRTRMASWKQSPEVADLLEDIAFIRALADRAMEDLDHWAEKWGAKMAERERAGRKPLTEALEAQMESERNAIEATLTSHHMRAGSLSAKWHKLIDGQRNPVTMDTVRRLLLLMDELLGKYVSTRQSGPARAWLEAKLEGIVLPAER